MKTQVFMHEKTQSRTFDMCSKVHQEEDNAARSLSQHLPSAW